MTLPNKGLELKRAAIENGGVEPWQAFLARPPASRLYQINFTIPVEMLENRKMLKRFREGIRDRNRRKPERKDQEK
jgi:hypothetical protein